MVRQRPRRAWWLVATGAVVLVLGAGFGVVAGRAWAERAAYLRARPCAGSPTAGCVEAVRAHVAGAQQVRQRGTGPGRRTELRVPLVATDQPSRDVPAARVARRDLDELERDVLYDRAVVTAGLWRGRPARLHALYRAPVETRASPVARAPRRTLEALLFLTAGAWLLGLGLRRRGDRWHATLLATWLGLYVAYDAVVRFGTYDGVRLLVTFVAAAAVTSVGIGLAQLAAASRTGSAAWTRTPDAVPRVPA